VAPGAIPEGFGRARGVGDGPVRPGCPGGRRGLGHRGMAAAPCGSAGAGACSGARTQQRSATSSVCISLPMFDQDLLKSFKPNLKNFE
jgi:hypothetical protein